MRQGDEEDAASVFTNEDRRRLLSLVYEYFLGTGLKQLKDVSGCRDESGGLSAMMGCSGFMVVLPLLLSVMWNAVRAGGGS